MNNSGMNGDWYLIIAEGLGRMSSAMASFAESATKGGFNESVKSLLSLNTLDVTKIDSMAASLRDVASSLREIDEFGTIATTISTMTSQQPDKGLFGTMIDMATKANVINNQAGNTESKKKGG